MSSGFESLMTQTNQSPCHQGVTQLNSFGQFYNAYNETSPTPVSNRFFSSENVLYLQDQLQQLLTRLVNFPVRVPINEEFGQTMTDVAQRNPGLGFLGDTGLQQMNEMFLEWEGRIQYLSIRQAKLYEQYFLKEDRPLFFPYPEPTKVIKGEVVIDTSGYMLTNPWKNNFGNYLNDVLQIGPYATPRCCEDKNPNPYSQPIRS